MVLPAKEGDRKAPQMLGIALNWIYTEKGRSILNFHIFGAIATHSVPSSAKLRNIALLNACLQHLFVNAYLSWQLVPDFLGTAGGVGRFQGKHYCVICCAHLRTYIRLNVSEWPMAQPTEAVKYHYSIFFT